MEKGTPRTEDIMQRLRFTLGQEGEEENQHQSSSCGGSICLITRRRNGFQRVIDLPACKMRDTTETRAASSSVCRDIRRVDQRHGAWGTTEFRLKLLIWMAKSGIHETLTAGCSLDYFLFANSRLNWIFDLSRLGLQHRYLECREHLGRHS